MAPGIWIHNRKICCSQRIVTIMRIQKTRPNTEAMKYKQSIDIENPDSIVFEPYLSHVRIDAISVQFANTMTSVALQNSDSVAPQYMGGTDCSLVINLTTTSESVAALLDKLPKYSAYLHRTYHLVLPMYPVKIDSDFTRMLGINEVSFDNIVVNTVRSTF